MNYVFFVALYLTVFCTQARTITCKVVDHATLKAIKGASIQVVGSQKQEISNHAGYFSLEISDSDLELLISCIGYETTRVVIPPQQQFKILLKTESIELPNLNVDSVYFQAPDSLFTGGDLTNGKFKELNAQYLGGWSNFYYDLSKIVKDEVDVYGLLDSFLSVFFTIHSDSSLSVSVKHPTASANSLSRIIRLTENWIPASQNGLLVDQHFTLKVTRQRTDFVPERPAGPPNGWPEFYKRLGNDLNYPATARRMGVEGKVFIQFTIHEDGHLSDFAVVKGIGAGCDEEVLRVVSKEKKWLPAIVDGKSITTNIVLPVIFALGSTASIRFGDFYTGPKKVNDFSYRESFQLWLSKNIDYQPKNLEEAGWVILKLEVDFTSGNIKSVKVIQGINEHFSEAALTALEKVPKELILRMGLSNGDVLLPIHFSVARPASMPKSFERLSPESKLLKPIHVIWGKGLSLENNDKWDYIDTVHYQFEIFQETTRITIRSQGLTKIPSKILKYRNLKFFDAEDNQLTELPVDLQKLRKLQEVYLASNLLTDFPVALGSLPLTVLGMANNRLMEFPKAVTMLKTLTALDLAGNAIKEVPESISNLTELSELYLRNNQIKGLPEEFYQLKNLKRLFLEGNPIPPAEKTKIVSGLPNTVVSF